MLLRHVMVEGFFGGMVLSVGEGYYSKKIVL